MVGLDPIAKARGMRPPIVHMTETIDDKVIAAVSMTASEGATAAQENKNQTKAILEEAQKKSEERRKADFSAQRSPEFLLGIERAVQMGQQDRVSNLIREMFPHTNPNIQNTFGDILTAFEMSSNEMLKSNTVWQYIRSFESVAPKKADAPIKGSPVRKPHGRGAEEEAILSQISTLSGDDKRSRDDMYSHALEAVLDDLRRRILLRLGVIGIQRASENIAAEIDLDND